MNKLDLIQALQEAADLTKQEGEKEYGSYIGRNPKTGQRVKIKSKRLPFFKPGKELRERVDG